jgi:hypothetical protein
MKVRTPPIAKITKAWLADAARVVRTRLPGAFNALRNLTSALADGIGRVRPGYQTYSAANGGLDAPTGMEVLKVSPIQSPAPDDVHIWYVNDGSKSIQMYPHYVGATRVAGTVDIGETFTFDALAFSTPDIPGDTIVFTSADADNVSTVDDYYNGWTLNYAPSNTPYDATSQNFLITDYDYDTAAGGTATFTVAGDPAGQESVGGKYTLARHFHDNPTFAPSYNNDLTAPIVQNVENSVIRLSGGQSSTDGNHGIIIFPKLTREFFPDSGDAVTFEGTYASERECRPATDILTSGSPVTTKSGGGNTEVLVPEGALGDLGDFTPTGAAFIAAIDDGSTPNDSDFIETVIVASNSKFLQVYCTPLTETIDPSGNISITIRYKANLTGTGTAAIEAGIWDATGEKSSATLSIPVDVASFTDFTFDTPVGDIDTDSMFIAIQFSHSGGGGLDNVTLDVSNIFFEADTMTTIDYLTADRTYWLGVAPVYDGFQLGQLYKLESGSDYAAVSGSWTDNYLATNPGIMNLNFNVSLGTLNKRITGFAIYGAVDEGATTVRANPYYFLKHLPIAATGSSSGDWALVSNNYFLTVLISQGDFTNKGNTYLTDAGYLETPADIMYAYSIEEIISGRRYLANAYIESASSVDSTSIFSNPTGGNGFFNAGVVQPDIFSNEEGVLKIKSDPSVGTQINGLVPIGVDEFLVLKNRGIIRSRVVVIDQVPNFIQKVESKDAGLSTVNAWAKDDAGVVVFPAFDDIYAYKDGQLSRLVEREDKNDWLSTYRGISVTDKMNAVVVYLPELKSHVFLFGSQRDPNSNIYNDLQFILGSNGWGSIFYETNDIGNATRSFKYFTQLSNGHIIGCDTATSGTATPFRMTWKTLDAGSTYTFGFTDNDEAIIPYFHTGDVYFSDGSYLMNEIIINRTMTGSVAQGQLDITVSSGDEIRDDVVGYDDVSRLVDDNETVTRRLRMNAPPNIIHKGNRWSIEYNIGNAPNHLTVGEVYQIDSIEIHGTSKSRRKEIAE